MGAQVGVRVLVGVRVADGGVFVGVRDGDVGDEVGDGAEYGVTIGVKVGDTVVPTDMNKATPIAPSTMRFAYSIPIEATNYLIAAMPPLQRGLWIFSRKDDSD